MSKKAIYHMIRITIVFLFCGLLGMSQENDSVQIFGALIPSKGMNLDTTLLPIHEVHPWPTKEQFKDAFVNLSLANDDLKRLRQNLDPNLLALKHYSNPDPAANFRFDMQQRHAKLYYAGQFPPISLLSPLAWYQFAQAWKRGDFKKQKKKY